MFNITHTPLIEYRNGKANKMCLVYAPSSDGISKTITGGIQTDTVLVLSFENRTYYTSVNCKCFFI